MVPLQVYTITKRIIYEENTFLPTTLCTSLFMERILHPLLLLEYGKNIHDKKGTYISTDTVWHLSQIH